MPATPVDEQLFVDSLIEESAERESVVAVLCSDIHISQNAPVARIDEDTWFNTMANHLIQLSAISVLYEAPVIFAGDLFDKWKSSPELINFAMEFLPDPFYAIPGQHDLPNHSWEERERSAYWVLVKAGRIKHLGKGDPINDICVYGFPWGEPITPPNPSSRCTLAVVHDYIWTEGYGFTGAPTDKKVTAFDSQLAGYSAAVFGDNHIPFSCVTSTGCQVMNTGGFMRRTARDTLWDPGVGLLKSDGTIIRHDLGVAKDDVITRDHITPETPTPSGLEEFVFYLSGMQQDSLDFRLAVKTYLEANEVSAAARGILIEALDE